MAANRAIKGELALIQQIRREWGGVHRRGAGVVLGIGDDCALLRPRAREEVALTTDLLLEGRHFRREWHPPRSAGHRALARGLSDLASMGARPMAAFLSIALPEGMLVNEPRWVEEFFTGLRDLGERYGIALAGGDTAQSPCGLVVADIVLTGSVHAGRALRRSAGKPGDFLYVTGELGGSEAELEALADGQTQNQARAAARGLNGANPHPQLFPEPRVNTGLELVRRGLARAAIDLSDGLSTDLGHLCAESGTGAEIEASALPLHPLAETRDPGRALALALDGGEDYELLFAAAPHLRLPRRVGGVRVTRIGRLVEEPGIRMVGPDGKIESVERGGWEHAL